MDESYLIPQRLDQDELLDQGVGSPDDVRANLIEMWRSNRWLGGLTALTRYLYPRLQSRPQHPVQIVDLGAGSAHVARSIAAWARGRGIPAGVVALDWAARNLAAARSFSGESVSLLQADALRLPFAPGSIDFTVSSLFLHHFSPDQVIILLRDVYQCTRRAMIMCDLVRGWLPLLAFRLVQPVFARHFLTRHDGALSIRRAYTPRELLDLAHAAGLPHARVHTHWPWRMTLVVER